eukprot:COSAG04_NODE_6555_length_1305_cov_11.768657_2_plen_133_part_00
MVCPNTYDLRMSLPVGTQAEGIKAPLRQRIGRERVVEAHRVCRGMPTSAATLPETAVSETRLQPPHGPRDAISNDAEERKESLEMERRRARNGAHRSVSESPASAPMSAVRLESQYSEFLQPNRQPVRAERR